MATILVVDDEMGIRELLSEILSDEGHVVELAEDAQQARDFRQRQVPDLVLLDISMPDTDGVTLPKEWAAQGRLFFDLRADHAPDYLQRLLAYSDLVLWCIRPQDVAAATQTLKGPALSIFSGVTAN